MTPGDITILTDFAVALIGFSGIVIAIIIGVHGKDFAPLDHFRTFSMLMVAFGAAFGSLIPLVLGAFGFAGNDLWRLSSIFLAVIILLTSMVGPVFAASKLEASVRKQLSVWVWILFVGGSGALSVWLFINAALMTSPGVFVIALIWQLILASILFVRLVLTPRK
ncbi:MAG: hypothetical protein COA47_14125 [Robiginitomaculum sp.]|nr:MAG: hypothetical protein COA47_14125 [Robiginitomaculum sp.]